MRATPGVGCHLDAEGGVVGLFIGVLHDVAGQDLAADIVVVQQVRQTLAVGGCTRLNPLICFFRTYPFSSYLYYMYSEI